MKLYLAAAYRMAPLMNQHAIRLASLGHVITSRWHAQASAALDACILDERLAHTATQIAQHDLDDITRADALLLFAQPGLPQRGGKHFETGYAYAIGKHVAVIGGIELLFHRLPGIALYADLEAWIQAHYQKGQV